MFMKILFQIAYLQAAQRSQSGHFERFSASTRDSEIVPHSGFPLQTGRNPDWLTRHFRSWTSGGTAPVARSETMNPIQSACWPVFLLCYVLFTACCATANSQDADFLEEELTPALVEQYEQKLNAILKTRTDQERLFVAQLVANVRTGAIPLKLVSTSFQWVRENRPLANYPFIYFEKVLRLQADKIGVVDAVPPFDFEAFRSAGQRARGQQLDAGQKTETQELTLLSAARSRIANLFRRLPSVLTGAE